jgi:hypothetical protein
MFCYRITKYNPEYRDLQGSYLKDEWISFFDIGKTFEEKILTPDQYLKVENAYIEAIFLFMDCLNITSLCIKRLEQHNELTPSMLSAVEGTQLFKTIKNDISANKEFIKVITRLVLREQMWCELSSPEMYVYFSWDYYMYIGSKKSCKNSIKVIERLGLFVEPWQSPHSLEDE